MSRIAREPQERWDLVLTPTRGWFDLDLAGLWRYRDLIFLLVKRDFVATYKQTVLGPLWYLIQPLLTTAMFYIVFTLIARIPTGEVPPLLFYFSGVSIWAYFNSCFGKTSDTFIGNAGIFSKVYFPRLVVPVSACFSNLIAFGTQFALLLCAVVGYALGGAGVSVGWGVLLVAPLLAYVALIGIALGGIVSALTIRYRDLTYVVGIATQFLMYGTPVVYPLTVIPDKWRWVFYFNPLVAPVESFRAAVLGTAGAGADQWAASLALTAVLAVAGLSLFSRAEKTSMDTV